MNKIIFPVDNEDASKLESDIYADEKLLAKYWLSDEDNLTWKDL